MKNNDKKNGLTLSKSLKNSVLMCKNANYSKEPSLQQSKVHVNIIDSRLYPIEVPNRRMRITENPGEQFSFRAVRKTFHTEKNELSHSKMQESSNRKISITMQKPSKLL